jgi:hypothetical protein
MKPEDKAVVQQALEALEYHTEQTRPIWKTEQAITALHQLLEQPEPVFCEYCGGNDDADFGLPTDHCTDCARPQPAQPAVRWSPALESVWGEPDHGDELTIAYLDGVHTGKQIAKREWVGLTDEERLQIMDGNTHFNMLVLAEAKLKEKNT